MNGKGRIELCPTCKGYVAASSIEGRQMDDGKLITILNYQHCGQMWSRKA